MSSTYNEARKKYYEKNKEIINKKMIRKISCPICTTPISYNVLAVHKKTKKHILNAKKLTDINI